MNWIFFQTLRGSFSAVSTPIFASKYSLESSWRDLQDLQDLHTFAPLRFQNFSQKSSTFFSPINQKSKITGKFGEIRRNSGVRKWFILRKIGKRGFCPDMLARCVNVEIILKSFEMLLVIYWFIDLLIDWLIDWLIDLLIDWLID